jgi:hypothetical protein
MIVVRMLRVFEDRARRRDEITREWIRLHNEKLYDLYSSRNTVWVIKAERIRWAGYVAYTWYMGEMRGVCRVLVGKPEGKRPLGRPTLRWEDDIEMDLQEVALRA